MARKIKAKEERKLVSTRYFYVIDASYGLPINVLYRANEFEEPAGQRMYHKTDSGIVSSNTFEVTKAESKTRQNLFLNNNDMGKIQKCMLRLHQGKIDHLAIFNTFDEAIKYKDSLKAKADSQKAANEMLQPLFNANISGEQPTPKSKAHPTQNSIPPKQQQPKVGYDKGVIARQNAAMSSGKITPPPSDVKPPSQKEKPPSPPKTANANKESAKQNEELDTAEKPYGLNSKEWKYVIWSAGKTMHMTEKEIAAAIKDDVSKQKVLVDWYVYNELLTKRADTKFLPSFKILERLIPNYVTQNDRGHDVEKILYHYRKQANIDRGRDKYAFIIGGKKIDLNSLPRNSRILAKSAVIVGRTLSSVVSSASGVIGGMVNKLKQSKEGNVESVQNNTSETTNITNNNTTNTEPEKKGSVTPTDNYTPKVMRSGRKDSGGKDKVEVSDKGTIEVLKSGFSDVSSNVKKLTEQLTVFFKKLSEKEKPKDVGHEAKDISHEENDKLGSSNKPEPAHVSTADAMAAQTTQEGQGSGNSVFGKVRDWLSGAVAAKGLKSIFKRTPKVGGAASAGKGAASVGKGIASVGKGIVSRAGSLMQGAKSIAGKVAIPLMAAGAAYGGISDEISGKKVENVGDIVPEGWNKLNPFAYAMNAGRYTGNKINSGIEAVTGGNLGSKVYDWSHGDDKAAVVKAQQTTTAASVSNLAAAKDKKVTELETKVKEKADKIDAMNNTIKIEAAREADKKNDKVVKAVVDNSKTVITQAGGTTASVPPVREMGARSTADIYLKSRWWNSGTPV